MTLPKSKIFYSSSHSMKNIDDEETGKKKKNVFIANTNFVVAQLPPAAWLPLVPIITSIRLFKAVHARLMS